MLVDTTDPTEAALHAGILAEPWNDVPRLMLADELDENVGRVECSGCKGEGWRTARVPPTTCEVDCWDCDASGTVSDGRAEQAAFIRVQIELAQTPAYQHIRLDLDWSDPEYSDECKRAVALRKRERELWANPYLPVDEVPRNWGLQLVGDDVTSDLPGYLFVSRGFVSEIRCTLAAFLGGECERCNGGQIDPSELWSPSAGARLKCNLCSGTGRVAGVAKRLFEAHPVTTVIIVGEGAEEWPSEKCVVYGRALAAMPSLSGSPGTGG